jgi:hypothetical protein
MWVFVNLLFSGRVKTVYIEVKDVDVEICECDHPPIPRDFLHKWGDNTGLAKTTEPKPRSSNVEK